MKPIKVALIGVGGISRMHYHGYQNAGAEVVAIADADADTLAKRKHDWNIARSYQDFEQMLAAESEVEAVSICLPNALHHPATLAAAKAGKHVLCEKPISLSLERGEEMVKACRDAGVILQIGHHLRSDGAYVKAKELIESGALGRITFVRMRQAHDWAGATQVRDSFGKLTNAGGGTLLDNGCHSMDLARYFGGDVREVFARSATLKYDVEVEDTTLVSMIFESGALGSVENAWTATGWDNSFSVFGTQGSLEYRTQEAWSEGKAVSQLHHNFRVSPGTTWADTDRALYTFTGYAPHIRSVGYFLEAIRSEREVVCSGEDGLEAIRLVMASYESARTHQPVQVHELEASNLKESIVGR